MKLGRRFGQPRANESLNLNPMFQYCSVQLLRLGHLFSSVAKVAVAFHGFVGSGCS